LMILLFAPGALFGPPVPILKVLPAATGVVPPIAEGVAPKAALPPKLRA